MTIGRMINGSLIQIKSVDGVYTVEIVIQGLPYVIYDGLDHDKAVKQYRSYVNSLLAVKEGK